MSVTMLSYLYLFFQVEVRGRCAGEGERGAGDKTAPELGAVLEVASKGSSLAGSGEVKAPALVELHVPHASHGLNLGLDGTKLVVVSVVTTLKQILVTSVARILVANPSAE